MTNVAFVTSINGIQADRIGKISKGLSEKRPDVKVEILDVTKQKELLEKLHLKYGPFVMVDGKLVFVGIPRLKMLLDKIESLEKGGEQQTEAASQ